MATNLGEAKNIFVHYLFGPTPPTNHTYLGLKNLGRRLGLGPVILFVFELPDL
jgi:hypothetical protein